MTAEHMESQKFQHDFADCIRFFENLKEEIEVSKKLEDLQDKAILKRMENKIEFLKKIQDKMCELSS